MKKEKFITSAIIVIVGGFITKLIGMIIRIIITRYIGLEGIGLYMLILPTFNLFIIMSQLGVPIAISKLVAEDKNNNKKLIFSIIPIIMSVNVFLIIVIYFLTPVLATYLLNNPILKYPLLSISVVLPFITISNIVRGYFFGKQKMFPHILSHIVEQLVRIIAIIIFVPMLYNNGIEYAVSGIILVNIASELISIIILIRYLPKSFKFKKEYLKPDKQHVKDIFNVGLPTTGAKIIGSISYFLEPIILTQTLLFVGYSSKYIITEYGIFSGYVLPLLMMPAFFSQAISSVLIPVISQYYNKNNINYIKHKINQALLFSFVIGFMATTCLIVNPLFFLELIYNTSEGVLYLRLLAPFFLIHYIQLPISSALIAMGKAQKTMVNTLISVIFKTIILLGASLFEIGLYGLIMANIIGILILTFLDYKTLKKLLN